MAAEGPFAEVTVSIFGLTDKGAVRKHNEDAWLVAELSSGLAGVPPELATHKVGERGTLLAVSDGMGGADAGDVASRLVVNTLSHELASAAHTHNPLDTFREAVERANVAVWDESCRRKTKRGMGATLAAAWIRGHEAFVTGVGDSRVYLMRGGRLRQVTRDQSIVESFIEAGVVTREEAQLHPQRNMVLQAMGVRPEVVVAIERVELRRNDLLLVCSDGLSGKLSTEEMRDCILMTPTIVVACRQMLDLSLERGGEDNITVLLAELEGEGLPETPWGERLTRTIEAVTRFDYSTGSGYAAGPTPAPTIPLGSTPPPKQGEEG
jgi:serine/threonine protein phosphatase PrpC